MLAPLLAVMLAGPVHADTPDSGIAVGLSIGIGFGAGHFYARAPGLGVAFAAADAGYLLFLVSYPGSESPDPDAVLAVSIVYAVARVAQIVSAPVVAHNRAARWEPAPAPAAVVAPMPEPPQEDTRRQEGTRRAIANAIVEDLAAELHPTCTDGLDHAKAVSAVLDLLSVGWLPSLVSTSALDLGLAPGGCLAPTLQGLLVQERP